MTSLKRGRLHSLFLFLIARSGFRRDLGHFYVTPLRRADASHNAWQTNRQQTHRPHRGHGEHQEKRENIREHQKPRSTAEEEKVLTTVLGPNGRNITPVMGKGDRLTRLEKVFDSNTLTFKNAITKIMLRQDAMEKAFMGWGSVLAILMPGKMEKRIEAIYQEKAESYMKSKQNG